LREVPVPKEEKGSPKMIISEAFSAPSNIKDFIESPVIFNSTKTIGVKALSNFF